MINVDVPIKVENMVMQYLIQQIKYNFSQAFPIGECYKTFTLYNK